MTDYKNNLHELDCEKSPAMLDDAAIDFYLHRLSECWEWDHDDASITAMFEFDDFAQTIGFVNAIAWVSQQQNHHPEISFAYADATVRFSTHSIHGLSLNDFICAARIDAMI